MKLPDRDLEYAAPPLRSWSTTSASSYVTGAGGGTRPHTRLPSPDFLSPPCSRTSADTQRQGATKQRFYRGSALLNGQGGTGRDTHLRSDCGQSVGTLNNPLGSYSGLQ